MPPSNGGDIFIAARSPARQQLADVAPVPCGEPDNSLTNGNDEHAET